MLLSLLRSSAGRSVAMNASRMLPKPAGRVLSFALTSSRTFGTSIAPSYPAAAKTTTVQTTTTTTKKKAAPKTVAKKTTTVKKTTAKKPTAKKPKKAAVKPKAKKVKAKPVVKKKPKKVVKPKPKPLRLIVKDWLGPKRLPSSFARFIVACSDRSKAEGIIFIPHTKLLEHAKAEWAGLSQAEKDSYAHTAEEKLKRKEEIEAWRKNLTRSQKIMVTRYKHSRGEPKPRLHSAYTLFVKDNFAKVNKPFTEAGRELAVMYKALSAEEVEALRARARAEYAARQAAAA